MDDLAPGACLRGCTSKVWTRLSQRARGGVAIGVLVRQRRAIAAGVPLLAAHHAGVTADADVEIDHEAELAVGGFGQGCHAATP